jgi:hypothetical protein
VVGAFLLSYVDWKRRDNLKNMLLIASAGTCCSISFLTKQTVGGGITVALLIVLVGLSIRDVGVRSAILRLIALCVGWAVPAAALLWWLEGKGAVGAFMRAIFVDGPSAKGSPRAIFLRVFFYLGSGQPSVDIFFSFCALAFMVIVVLAARSGMRARPSVGTRAQLAIIAALGSGSLVAGYMLGGVFGHVLFRAVLLLEFCSIHLGFLGSLALTIYYAFVLLQRVLTHVERQRWILVTSSFWICYTLSWSDGAWGPMAFPCLGVVIAFGLEYLSSMHGTRALRFAIAAGTMLLLVASEIGRVHAPYVWEGWSDAPIRSAVASSSQPILAGMYMSPETADFTDRLTRIIQSHSQISDPVFIYSYQPLWYVLANRWPPTFAQVHYFDVAPDDICRSDAERIVKARPTVIVDFNGDRDLALGEQQFRDGKHSGQRDLYERMNQLIQVDYDLEAVLNVPETFQPVRVFVLKGGR